jgi:hypothetical protein
VVEASGLDDGACARWEAEHDGYARLSPPATHRRRVELDRPARALTVVDRLESAGEHACRLAFHLGPTVRCELDGARAALHWPGAQGDGRVAELRLPPELDWSAVSGQLEPPLGWYSPAFDEKHATVTLLGVGRLGGGRELRSQLHF